MTHFCSEFVQRCKNSGCGLYKKLGLPLTVNLILYKQTNNHFLKIPGGEHFFLFPYFIISKTLDLHSIILQ